MFFVDRFRKTVAIISVSRQRRGMRVQLSSSAARRCGLPSSASVTLIAAVFRLPPGRRPAAVMTRSRCRTPLRAPARVGVSPISECYRLSLPSALPTFFSALSERERKIKASSEITAPEESLLRPCSLIVLHRYLPPQFLRKLGSDTPERSSQILREFANNPPAAIASHLRRRRYLLRKKS